MTERTITSFEQTSIREEDVLELQEPDYLKQLRAELREEAARCLDQADRITDILVEWGEEQRIRRRRIGRLALHDGGGDGAA